MGVAQELKLLWLQLQQFASNSTDPSSHIHYEDISGLLLKIYDNSQRQIEVNRFRS